MACFRLLHDDDDDEWEYAVAINMHHVSAVAIERLFSLRADSRLFHMVDRKMQNVADRLIFVYSWQADMFT